MPAALEEVEEALERRHHVPPPAWGPNASSARAASVTGVRVSRGLPRLRRERAIRSAIHRGLRNDPRGRHGHRRHRPDRATSPSSAPRTASRPAGAGSSSTPTPWPPPPPGSTRAVTPPSVPASPSTPSPTARRAARSIDEFLRGRPCPEAEITVEIDVQRALRAGLGLRRHPAPEAAHRARSPAASASPRSRSASASTAARREGIALPPLLDQHDLRAERRRRDRVHPLRRLPGHLPRGLHRDRALPPARDAPASRRDGSSRPFAGRGRRRGLDPASRTKRSASAAACAPLRCPVGTITMQSFQTKQSFETKESPCA